MSSRRLLSVALRVAALGAVALLVGLFMASSHPSSSIVCDGHVMGPGDTCISTSSSHNGSYEDLVRRDRESSASSAAAGPVVAVLGGLVLAGGGLTALLALRRPTATPGRPDPSRPAGGGDTRWW